ncbi:MAG: DUF362 domain-containing protein [Candidatus Eisenbacteria bacterium]
MSAKTIYTRRDFLKGTACGAAGFALGIPAARRAFAETVLPSKRSRAVLVRDLSAALPDGSFDPDVLSRMLDDAVAALAGAEDPKEAWAELLSSDDVLGIKSNIWPSLPTPPALEEAIRGRALEVGIPGVNISTGDQRVLDDPVFLRATALINIRPVRTHHWSGIGGCIKNYIMFVREPWKWHDDSCADLAGVWKEPVCAGKTRLNVLVALRPLFYGIGPHHFDPLHVWPYNGLLVGTDPVALDALAVKLLEEKRKAFFEKPPRGGTSAKHVRIAETRWGLGVADIDRIDIVRIGPMEDALI